MILNDEYMREFTQIATFDHDVVLRHEKCGEESEPNLNLLGIVQWAEKHRYSCPEIEVESITVGGLKAGQHAVVTLLADGRIQVDVIKGSEIVKSVSRKLLVSRSGELIQQKKPEKKND